METRKYYDYQVAFDMAFSTIAKKVADGSPIFRRLRNCNAVVMYTRRYIALMSYRTVVAVYDDYTGRLLINGWYSRTTSQHIAKFKHDFIPNDITILYREPVYGNVLCTAFDMHGVWKKSKNNSLFFRRDDGSRFDDCADGLFCNLDYDC